MRQKLPETAGYPLMVNDIGRTIGPGEEFDCPLPVPGCVPVEDADSPAGDAPGDDPGSGGKAAEAAPGAQDQPAKGRAQRKEQGL